MSYREHIITEPKTAAFGKTWVLSAPWAHPLWSSYAVLLYDLTTELEGQPAPTIHREGMTHELMVFALDPNHPADPPTHLLQPANYGYQFAAASNEAAVDRVTALLEEIESGTLSPDTDFRSMWDARFTDGVTLHGKGGAA